MIKMQFYLYLFIILIKALLKASPFLWWCFLKCFEIRFTFKPVCVYINYLVTFRDTPAVYYYLNQNIMFYPIGYTSVYNKSTTGKFRYNTVCIWGSNSITWYVDNTEIDHSDSQWNSLGVSYNYTVFLQ